MMRLFSKIRAAFEAFKKDQQRRDLVQMYVHHLPSDRARRVAPSRYLIADLWKKEKAVSEAFERGSK